MPPRRRNSKARAASEPPLPSVPEPLAAAAEPLVKDVQGLVRDLSRVRRLDALPRVLLSRLSPQAGLIFAAGLAVGGAVVVAAGLGDSSASTSKPSSHAPSKVSMFKRMTGGSLTEVLPYGSPGPLHDLIRREAYVTAYDRAKKHPAWTAQHLTAASLRRPPSAPDPSTPPSLPPPTVTMTASTPAAPALGPAGPAAIAPTTLPPASPAPEASTERTPPATGGDRTRSTFKEDLSIDEPFRAKLADYVGSGYDRGHMVPAADAKRTQAGMDETFYLTNIAPQVGEGFNRHYLAKKERDGKWRVSYEVIGPPSLAPSISVPTHFAKVILGTGGSDSSPALGAFVLPNARIPDHTPLESFVTPVEAVEIASGLTLFGEDLKRSAMPLCSPTRRCEIVQRYFDESGNLLSAPPKGVKTKGLPEVDAAAA